MAHAVKGGDPGWALLGTGTRRNNGARLNGFQSRLHFTGTLVALGGFFRQTTLNNGPQTRRYGRTERSGQLAHDRRADLEAGASTEGQLAGSGFVQNNSEGPEIAAAVGWFAAQNFRSHVVQSAADRGCILRASEGLCGTFEDGVSGAF